MIRPLGSRWVLRVIDAAVPGVYPRTVYLEGDTTSNESVRTRSTCSSCSSSCPSSPSTPPLEGVVLAEELPTVLDGRRRTGLYEAREPLFLPTLSERLGPAFEDWLAGPLPRGRHHAHGPRRGHRLVGHRIQRGQCRDSRATRSPAGRSRRWRAAAHGIFPGRRTAAAGARPGADRAAVRGAHRAGAAVAARSPRSTWATPPSTSSAAGTPSGWPPIMPASPPWPRRLSPRCPDARR